VLLRPVDCLGFPADDRGGSGARPAVDLAQRLHDGDTTQIDKQLITSGAAFERRVGYSRAVRVGDRVWVSGTAPIMPDDADPPASAYEQARVCLGIVARALAEAGATLDDVVRTRIYVTDAGLIDEVGRAHGEAFARARPATTGIVTQLLDPRWLVEIEAEAVIVAG
jgi:enamine deaminase RidA (YjgF/YER057c/UK114 family)